MSCKPEKTHHRVRNSKGYVINKRASKKPKVNIAALSAVQPLTPSSRMRVQLDVEGKIRTALIDSGCSALIISKRLVEERN